MTTQALKKVFLIPRKPDQIAQEAAECVKAANEDAREILQRLDTQAQEYAQAVLAETIRNRRSSGQR